MSVHMLAKRKNVYPCKPKFYYIKVGCKGSTLHGHVSMMSMHCCCCCCCSQEEGRAREGCGRQV